MSFFQASDPSVDSRL